MERFEIGEDKIRNGRIIEGSFAEDLSLSSVIIPEGVTDRGEIAFYGCANLKEVVFPSSLRYIREEAFGDSAITEAILPAGLELIEEKAFNNLKGLIYFTDGFGTFPAKKPVYETAFVFLDEGFNNYDVPPWAIKLVLQHEDIIEGGVEI